MAKGTIKFRIPGSKEELELPKWAPYVLGGAGLIAIFLLGDRDQVGERVEDGVLAAELAQRLEEERQKTETSLSDVLMRIEEIGAREPEAAAKEPVTTRKAVSKIAQQQYIPGSGQIMIGEVPFVSYEEEKIKLSEAEILQQARAMAAYATRLTEMAKAYESGKIASTVTAYTEKKTEAVPEKLTKAQKAEAERLKAQAAAYTEKKIETVPEKLTKAQKAEAERLKAQAAAYTEKKAAEKPKTTTEAKRQAEREATARVAAAYVQKKQAMIIEKSSIARSGVQVPKPTTPTLTKAQKAEAERLKAQAAAYAKQKAAAILTLGR